MLIRNSYIIYTLLTLGLLVCLVPYLFNLGGDNVFIKDFYAKRIMAVSTIPFIIILLLKSIQDGIEMKIYTWIYFILWTFYLVYSVLHNNDPKYLIVDAYTAFLPIFFIITSRYLNDIKILNNFFIFILLTSVTIVSFGIKLQYSYISLIGIIYILFYMKINYKNIVFIALLPLILFQSLIGKSAVLMLLFLFAIVFLFEKNYFTLKKKIIFLTLALLLSVSTLIFGSQYLIKNHSYQHFVYFLSNTDFRTFEFNDASTGNRLFEANQVLLDFKKRTFIEQFYGKGFGSTIDLSDTMDQTVLNTNSDPTKIHNIHMGFFAVLYRYGYVGIILYLMLTVYIVRHSFTFFKNNNIYAKFSSLYLLIIVFDSYISFPHMMSNYFFWFTLALLYKGPIYANTR